MREFKFRAWDVNRKCWLKSNDRESGHIKSFIWDYIIAWSDNKLLLIPDVYPVVIEQFTGLKDKNGKEIYEGDILKVNGVGTLMQVKWNKSS